MYEHYNLNSVIAHTHKHIHTHKKTQGLQVNTKRFNSVISGVVRL